MFDIDVVFAILQICHTKRTGDRVVCAASWESIELGVDAAFDTIKKERKKNIATLIKNFHFLFGHF